MLLNLTNLSLKTIDELFASLLEREEYRTGFKIEAAHASHVSIDCGDLGQFLIPIKPFPHVYNMLIWNALGSISYTSSDVGKIVYNKYYIAKKNPQGVVTLPKEILEKVPDLYPQEETEGTFATPVLENLTLENLNNLCHYCIDMAELMLEPESYLPIAPADIVEDVAYLVDFNGKWNVVVKQKDTGNSVLWRFGLPKVVPKLKSEDYRIIPEYMKKMPPKMLSYRFESTDPEGGTARGNANPESEVSGDN